jgi:hypothetical protein
MRFYWGVSVRRTLVAAGGAFGLAAAVAGTGLTAAEASQRPAQTEAFRLVSGQVSGRASVIATGAFTAGGTANLNTGSVTLHFPGGTVRVKPRATQTNSAVDQRNCLLTVLQQGTYQLGHGTGRYAHLTGGGTYVLSVTGLLARDARGRCTESRPARALQQVITAHGPVRGG